MKRSAQATAGAPEPAAGPARWVCAQLGSREHYAIPRALHRTGRLQLLLTDYWSRPGGGLAGAAPGDAAARAAQRFHPDLADAEVEHMGVRRLLFELGARLARRSGWRLTMDRNRAFQRLMARRMRTARREVLTGRPGIFFAYSYAALDLLALFRAHGWKTVLGQIDPGRREEKIVAAAHARHPEISSRWAAAPKPYWQAWREEWALCDRIVVNSAWSRDALIRSGVPRSRLTILPLAFEPGPAPPRARAYPERFTAARPLRVLFLGQLNLRKGVHLALEAARLLEGRPVEWRFVGPAEIEPPAASLGRPGIRWSGPVSRSETVRHYREADLFLLPTLSDGFALTQLEAQAAGLPVAASRFCGEVVREGVNGWILDPLSAQAIAAVVEGALRAPADLAARARASRVDPAFSLAGLEAGLLQLESTLLQP